MPGVLRTKTDSYTENGFCIHREVVTGEPLEAAREQLDAMMASLGADQRPERMTEPHQRDEFWLELCRNTAVLDAVETVLGPDLILLMSHLIVKPPADGMPVHWHQDNTYWPTVNGPDIATVWLALDDVDLDNGCMTVLPGSHVGRPELEKIPTEGGDLLNLTVEIDEERTAGAVPVELRAGDLSIHDSYLLHASATNTSSRRRAGYTMRYGAAATTVIDPGHWAKIYRVRGRDVPLAPGQIDFRA